MTIARDPAIRMALQAMLAEGIAEELQGIARERLANKTGWTDTERTEALRLAQTWARSKDPAWGTAIRKALGEEIPDDPMPPQRNAPASTSLLTRALAARSPAEEKAPVNSIAQAIYREETDLMTPDYARELAIVSREMERPPYYFPDDTERLRKATALVAQGKVVYSSFGHYEVTGSKGTSYVIQDDVRECPCPQGQKAKSKWCYHLIATVIHKEVAIRIGPHEPSLFPPPKTIEERLATVTPQESHQATSTPQDDTQTVSTPEPATEAPRASQEPSMATAPANDAFIPEPEPAPVPMPRLTLPRRSITAIVADLSRPLPQDCVATLPASQKRPAQSYLHWHTVATLLDTYAPGWHGAVVRVEKVGEKCAVTYRITIPAIEGDCVREDAGMEDEDKDDYGDAMTNAIAMAFKRAAAKFGLGRWLYAKDSTDEALTQHIKKEKAALLGELAQALAVQRRDKDAFITWLRASTSVTRNADIPITALKAALAQLAMDEA